MKDGQKAMLQTILEYDAKQAKWGAKASKLKKDYCILYSPLLKGEKVLFNPYDDDPVVNGIVELIKFNNGGFRYLVREYTKNWEIKKRRHPIWINDKEKGSIIKFIE